MYTLDVYLCQLAEHLQQGETDVQHHFTRSRVQDHPVGADLHGSRSNRTADVCRVTDEFGTTLYSVIVDRQIIHECDTEHDARIWVIRNI